ncbi:MAG: saccharopine dehydrogenase [Rhodospirillales bacterium]|nr:saccharopine dehydrogenase [Rhodospirillales bacterium]
MTRILVVGGTGVFGSRLVDGLVATTDFCIIISGRDPSRCEAAAGAVRKRYPAARIETATIDARSVTPIDIHALNAAVVIDAAGPFQGAEPRLAETTIEAGCDYIDLADARDFVARFPMLDAAAKATGAVAVTGMSSTPALSHAVLDSLTAGWRRIDRIEVGISTGNRAPRGLSVVSAILAWAGQPIRIFSGGSWISRRGWSGTVSRRIGDLGDRRLALAETPDLDLLEARFKPRDSALFRAGLELGILHYGLVVLAWFTEFSSIRSLSPLAPAARYFADAFKPFGTDRGGMMIEAAGRDAQGMPVFAGWSLVAEAGDGPFVPTLPALALVRVLVNQRGAIPAGAHTGAGLLSLELIGAEFSRHRIQTATTTSQRRTPLEVALGDSFDLLPDAVKAVHRAGPTAWLVGTAQVEGAQSRIGVLFARLFGFPAASEHVGVRVMMRLHPDGTETWERDFGGRRLRSRLAPSGRARITESFGPFTFDVAVEAEPRGLTMRVVGWRLGKLVLPRSLAPRSNAFESVDGEGLFSFEVPIAVPLLRRLVRYRGSLTLVEWCRR